MTEIINRKEAMKNYLQSLNFLKRQIAVLKPKKKKSKVGP